MQMKRVVVFLPPEAVKTCDTLAGGYGSNRSEVVRLAVAEGLPGAVEALERVRELRLVEAARAGAARLWRVRGARKRPGREPDAEPLDQTVKLRFSVRQSGAARSGRAPVGDVAFVAPARSDQPGFSVLRREGASGRRAGLAPREEYRQPDAAGPRRGPRSDGLRADRWVNAPRRRR